jgi:ssDNA-binding Zn-finger/Zn-ribbon topoisomerase 1
MVYYQCPDCGYKQKSQAQKRVQCHQCGRSYLKRKAKKFEKKTSDMDKEDKKKSGFHTYSKKDKE